MNADGRGQKFWKFSDVLNGWLWLLWFPGQYNCRLFFTLFFDWMLFSWISTIFDGILMFIFKEHRNAEMKWNNYKTLVTITLKMESQICRLCENCLKIWLLLRKKFCHIIRKQDHSITFTTYIELLYEREVTHEFRAEGRSENLGGRNSNVAEIFCPKLR